MIESNVKKIDSLLNSGKKDSAVFENNLRPKSFSEYIGQDLIKDNLLISIQAALKRKEALDHILLFGAPGLGKTTLANIVSKEFGVNLKITSGPALEKQGDLVAILSNMQEKDIIFIDEIHRLKPIVEEVLYTALEDFGIDIILGQGPSARTMRVNLPKFTLIGATTKLSMISSPLRDRFGNVFRLQFYSEEDIKNIILRSAKILNINIDEKSAYRLANCSRRTPRIANRLLKRVRDYAEVKNKNGIDVDILNEALTSLGVDSFGLDDLDREILNLIMEKFDGGPVGLNTISAATYEEENTIEDIYEPYLIHLGFLERTPRGRIITTKAIEHLKTQK
ncbi:MAG: Holliday junction branch migration DNA helicase RuvB [Candidatus Gracilibacteria bacterium]|jgi:Holliday junction DNA helicase RuvB